MERKRAWLSWSTGKDSAWCLEMVRRQGDYEVEALTTTVNAEYNRVAMHAVRESLLQAQAERAGLPLVTIPIPSPCPNAAYERAMTAVIEKARAEGITHMIFGDLFLEDIRRYRENQLSGTGITPVFPLWGLDTGRLASQMLNAGVRAVLTCIDPKKLDPSFAGRQFDVELLADLPDKVDPCGENGEFHTFAWCGPMFKAPIEIKCGAVVERGGFVFADILPTQRVQHL